MRTAAAAIYCGLLTAMVGCPASSRGQETALDRYVAAADPSYHYNLINTVAGDGYTGYVLEMTSQNWRTPAEVDRPIWTHWLTIVRPEHSVTSTSLLLVSGGGRASARSASGKSRRGHPRTARQNAYAVRSGEAPGEVFVTPRHRHRLARSHVPLSLGRGFGDALTGDYAD